MTTVVPPSSTGMPSSRAAPTRNAAQVGAERFGGRDERRPRPVEERVRASPGAVDELVAHDERAELEVEAKRAADDRRDNPADADLLQRPDVGPVGDLVGWDLLLGPAPRQERHLLASDLGDSYRRRRIAVRGLQLDAVGLVEGRGVARDADDPELGFGHGWG